MEPGDRAAQEVSARTRVRFLAVMVLLVGVAFIQNPGYLVSDTKFDLAVAPAHFLERALHLWDSQGAFGQLQNQAYGYLWPMGPFFAILHVADVPGWVAQRLWQALILCVAFLGTARLARALGARSDVACVVAGLGFALSPRMLTVLGPLSIEAWPSALTPWVLLFLVRGSAAGSPRRAAALSGLAVAMVGGVNAAATFAVLPLGVLWLLTRGRGPRRRSLMLWWPVFTLLGTLWWLVPLFVMGHYSPPFLDYIETTTVTTFPTTVFDSLRGTSDWIPYVSADSRAGNDLLTTAYLALNSGLVLLVGFAGLLDRRNPHRLFFSLAVLVGLLMVTAGHHGAVQGLFTSDVRGLLDGSLAPLRNVHKFDPIIRLPLVLGMAFVVDQVLAARAATPQGRVGVEQRLQKFNSATLLAMILVGVVGSSIPGATGRLEAADPVSEVPQYWQDAARWLKGHDQNGTALLVPGSAFGTYVWGSPKDEPLQFLARSPWAVRNAIPLSPAGNIRMLNAIEDRLAQGRGSSGLASYLRRNGIGYLVVRNDLRPGNDVPDPVLVHQALADSPGLGLVAAFGPQVGGGAHLTTNGIRTLINGGWQTEHGAVEVYGVPGAGAGTGGSPTVVAGGPEDLLDLEDLRVIGAEPVVLASDVGAAHGVDPAAAPYVLTDGLRKRQRYYARIHDGYSAVVTPGDRLEKLNPRRDYLDAGDDRWATTVALEGARAISASSSGSDPDVFGGARRGELPFAAVDGSAGTEWVSNPARDERTWWQLTLTSRRDVRRVTILGGPSADRRQAVRVRTQNGASKVVTAGPGQPVTVDLPSGGPTAWLRVESPDTSNRLLSLAVVAFDGLTVQRRLVLPTAPRAWGNPGAVVLRADLDARRGCAVVDNDVRCVQGTSRASEEPVGAARRFDLASDGGYAPQLLVRPHAGAALDAILTRQQPVTVSASSTATPDPRSSPLAAIDGDPATTWTADVADIRPSLSLNWIGKRPISGIALSASDDTAARRPQSLLLEWPGGRRKVELGADGRASFAPIRTSALRIQVLEAAFATNLGFDLRASQIGVGIQELRLTGLPYLPVALSTRSHRNGCGTGPRVELNGVDYPTSVSATPAQLFAGVALAATLCSPGASSPSEASAHSDLLALRAGTNDVSVAGSASFDFVSLVLRDPAASGPAPPTGAARRRVAPQGPGSATLHPAAGAALVNLDQNANPGWRATQDGRELRPVVLNGWQQGWFVRSGSPVMASYGPDGVYRLGLGVGLLALLVAAASALVRPRRRREPPPLPHGSMPDTTALVLVAVASALIAGWVGVLVTAVSVALAFVLEDSVPDVVPWLFGGCCFAAAFAYFVHPWADSSGWAGDEAWPHYLALVPVVASVVLAARGRPSRLSLRLGVSTRR